MQWMDGRADEGGKHGGGGQERKTGEGGADDWDDVRDAVHA
jgi:hypothetical protein